MAAIPGLSRYRRDEPEINSMVQAAGAGATGCRKAGYLITMIYLLSR